MNYLIIASLLRSGSHMLRSMLSADPTLYDAGQWLPRTDDFRGWIEEHQKSADDRTMVINTKVTITRDPAQTLDVAKELGAPVLFLTRHNLLAQVVSWELACQYRHHPEMPLVVRDNLSPEEVAMKLYHEAAAVQQFRHALVQKSLPHAEIAYEELLADRLRDALSGLLQRAVLLGPPVTEKVTPPIAEAYPQVLAYGREAAA